MESAGNRSVQRACAVLRCFQQSPLPLGLAQVAEAAGLNKPTTYRMLMALVEGGMIERLRKNTYALKGNTLRGRSYRLGYATQSEEFSFSRLVSESVRASAYNAGIELLELNNRYSPTTAVRNAETFVREGVHLVIEFQTSLESASTVASKLVDAAIPLIAIDIPHPGGLYFGANNYRAGMIAGRALAHACKDRWRGQFDELILLELKMAGPLVRSRLTGMIAGLREVLGDVKDDKIRFMNGNGRYETSLAAMRKDLGRSKSRKILLGAINDPSCLGALSAFMEAGRGADCLAISHNGALEARRELRRPGTSLIGSVAYFPEQYGEGVMQLALDTLQGRRVPPAVFVKHELLDRQTVDRFYPNDPALAEHDADSLLYSSR